MATILIVDDDEAVRGPLGAQLEQQGHVVETAANGAEAVERVRSNEYDLIVSDLRMPVMDGLQFLNAVVPYVEGVTPCVILTAYNDIGDAVRSLQLGAFDFVRKPWELVDMRAVVHRALLRRADLKFRREHRRELERRVDEATRDLKRAYDETVIGFAALLEGKDESTAEHCHRVRDVCVRLAEEMGLPRERLRDLELGAMLHDIGKFKVPDAILKKPGPLTPDEWTVMRRHPEYGAEIVERIDFLRGAGDVVRNHHERFDGTGYPRGLKGEEIPLAARIFMVADAFDAIVSKRSYKGAAEPEVALLEIRRSAGTHFDPDVVAAFDRIYPSLRALTPARV